MRKVVYYLPNINLVEDDEIVFSDCKLLKAEGQKIAGELIDENVFGEIRGVLIEAGDFKSGDPFCRDSEKQIQDKLELIKFSYFLKAVSKHLNFVSNDSFDIFSIIERSKDKSFEQKIRFSNGIDDYFLSLDQFYSFKSKQGDFCKAELRLFDLDYYDLVNSLTMTKDDQLTISIFNKTRNLYNERDFFDRVLFARVCTERLFAKLNWYKKEGAKRFVIGALEKIKGEISSNNCLREFYEKHVEANKEKIISNLDNYLNSIRIARHSLAHEGIQDQNHNNIECFLVWFPLAFILSFDYQDISGKLSSRVMLFLCCLNVDVTHWKKRNIRDFPAKRTVLETYEYTANVLPKMIHKGDLVYTEALLTGMASCLS